MPRPRIESGGGGGACDRRARSRATPHVSRSRRRSSPPQMGARSRSRSQGPLDSLPPLLTRLTTAAPRPRARELVALRLTRATSGVAADLRAYLAGREASMQARWRSREAGFSRRSCWIPPSCRRRSRCSAFCVVVTRGSKPRGWPWPDAIDSGPRRGASRLWTPPTHRTRLDQTVAGGVAGTRMSLKPGTGWATRTSQRALGGRLRALSLRGGCCRRGWAIDSGQGNADGFARRSPLVGDPSRHWVELAQMHGDTALVRRFVALGLVADFTGKEGWYLRWQRAERWGCGAPTALGRRGRS